MVYPVVDWQKWAKLYKIKTTPIPCSKCQTPVEGSAPIAFDGYRGIEFGTCPNCGTKSDATRLVPVSKEKLDIFGLLLEWRL